MSDIFINLLWLLIIILFVSSRTSKKAKRNWKKQQQLNEKQANITRQKQKVDPKVIYRQSERRKPPKQAKSKKTSQIQFEKLKPANEKTRNEQHNGSSALEDKLRKDLSEVLKQAGNIKKSTGKKKPPSVQKKEKASVLQTAPDDVATLPEYELRYKTMTRSRYADRSIDIKLENLDKNDQSIALDLSFSNESIVHGIIWKEILDRRAE